MSPQTLLNLFKRNALWFILAPLLTVATIYYVTRNQPNKYVSKATIYTGLASGYSLLSDDRNNRIDHTAVNNAFDNLLTTVTSRETSLQVGINLLARHLELRRPDTLVLSVAGMARLYEAIPDELRRSLQQSHGRDALVRALDRLSRANGSNAIKRLLIDPKSPYSAEYINKHLKATRKNTSDMLEMEYETDDPAVARQTLDELINVMGERYRDIKQSETNPVVAFYQKQSQQAKQKLDQIESKLQAFSVEHNVLNYDEEAKNVASQRESLTDDYNRELMRNKAAKASVDALNKRIGNAGTYLEANNDVIRKKDELFEAQSRLTNAQAYGQSAATIGKLQAEVDRISNELKANAQKYYAAGNTAESIPQQRIIDDWLNKTLDYEESQAKLDVYKQRLGEYKAKTTEYSPMGSQLRQLNRDLGVAEKEYLAAVQSLNQARTHRKDAAIDGPLTVLDAPNFPAEPESSKRLILLILGAGVGLFLALLIMALRQWLDNRVASPERAEVAIGRPVTAVFPAVTKFSIESKASRAALGMFEQLCSAINIEIVQASLVKKYPPVITLFSIRSGQGKSWVGGGLARIYAESGQRVAFCYPRQDSSQTISEQHGITSIPYTLRADFMNVPTIDELISRDYERFEAIQFDKIILELPPLINSPIPVFLVNESYVSLLVADANNGWPRTEKQLLGMYTKIATHSVLAVLNRVGGDQIDAPSRSDARQSPIQPERLIEIQG